MWYAEVRVLAIPRIRQMFWYKLLVNRGLLSGRTCFGAPYLKTRWKVKYLATSRHVVGFKGPPCIGLVKQSAIKR